MPKESPIQQGYIHKKVMVGRFEDTRSCEIRRMSYSCVYAVTKDKKGKSNYVKAGRILTTSAQVRWDEMVEASAILCVRVICL